MICSTPLRREGVIGFVLSKASIHWLCLALDSVRPRVGVLRTTSGHFLVTTDGHRLHAVNIGQGPFPLGEFPDLSRIEWELKYGGEDEAQFAVGEVTKPSTGERVPGFKVTAVAPSGDPRELVFPDDPIEFDSKDLKIWPKSVNWQVGESRFKARHLAALLNKIDEMVCLGLNTDIGTLFYVAPQQAPVEELDWFGVLAVEQPELDL